MKNIQEFFECLTSHPITPIYESGGHLKKYKSNFINLIINLSPEDKKELCNSYNSGLDNNLWPNLSDKRKLDIVEVLNL